MGSELPALPGAGRGQSFFARLGSQQEIIKTLRILLPLDTGDAVESAASRKNG
jgi:hypothetical protein